MLTITGLPSKLMSSNRIKLMLLATPVLIGSGLCLYYYYYYNNGGKSKRKKKDETKEVVRDPVSIPC